MAVVERTEINNTDLRFQEEFDTIMKNIGKLEVGSKYKYPLMVSNLEIEFKPSGATRQAQIKRIKTYLNWESRTGLYSGLVNEGEGVEAVMKKTTSSEYYELVRDCFLLNLAELIEDNPTKEVFTLGYTRVLKMAELISEGYLAIATKEDVKIASELLDVDTNSIAVYREKLRQDGISIVRSTLNQMKKEKLIVCDEIVTFFSYLRDSEGNLIFKTNNKGEIVRDVIYTKADIKQREILMECESLVLKEMYPKVEPRYRMYIVKVNSQYDTFRHNVIVKLKEYKIFIDGYFECYEIDLNKSDTKNNIGKILTRQALELKMKICNKMRDIKDKNYKETIRNNSFGKIKYQEKINTMNGVMVWNDSKFNTQLEHKKKELKEEKELKRLEVQRHKLEAEQEKVKQRIGELEAKRK